MTSGQQSRLILISALHKSVTYLLKTLNHLQLQTHKGHLVQKKTAQSQTDTQTHTCSRPIALFSGTTRVSRCQKRTSGLHGATTGQLKQAVIIDRVMKQQERQLLLQRKRLQWVWV